MANPVETGAEGFRALLDFIQRNAARFWEWIVEQSVAHPVLLSLAAVFILVAVWLWRRRPKGGP